MTIRVTDEMLRDALYKIDHAPCFTGQKPICGVCRRQLANLLKAALAVPEPSETDVERVRKLLADAMQHWESVKNNPEYGGTQFDCIADTFATEFAAVRDKVEEEWKCACLADCNRNADEIRAEKDAEADRLIETAFRQMDAFATWMAGNRMEHPPTRPTVATVREAAKGELA